MAASAKIARENGKKGGRPKGATTKPRISDYLSEAEVIKLVSKVKEMAFAGDANMLKLLTEQHFGKAIQPMEGDFKANINITFDNAFTYSPTGDSKK